MKIFFFRLLSHDAVCPGRSRLFFLRSGQAGGLQHRSFWEKLELEIVLHRQICLLLSTVYPIAESEGTG